MNSIAPRPATGKFPARGVDRHRLVFPVITACALAFATPATAAIDAGTATRGGLSDDTAIIHVTSLDDSGPGSLRDALDQAGPRVIVFDVAGTIALASDIKIHEPYVTIAGQTAPNPGIELRGASMRIRTHDVVVAHIAVRPGPSPSPEVSDNLDAISIDGQAPFYASYDIRLENVSTSWSVDESISTWYATTHSITIRNCLIADSLRNAGHPKGPHSMALLVGDDSQGVAVTGNLLVANDYRNPVIAHGASAFVANNYIVDPGFNAVHFYSSGTGNPDGVTAATVMNNMVQAGLDSSDHLSAVQIPVDMPALSPGAQIFVNGNVLRGRDANDPITNPGNFVLAASAPVTATEWRMIPAAMVPLYTISHAGSRPYARGPVDGGIVYLARLGLVRVIDSPTQAAHSAALALLQAPAPVPDSPMMPAGTLAKSRLEAWLCLRHLQVGGPATPQCKETMAVLQAALAATPVTVAAQ